MKQLVTVESVKRWAMDNYERGASCIIECYEDREIQTLIDECTKCGTDPMETFKEIAGIWEENHRAAQYFGMTPNESEAQDVAAHNYNDDYDECAGMPDPERPDRSTDYSPSAPWNAPGMKISDFI